MGPDKETQYFDDAPPLPAAEDLTADEQALLGELQQSTPMPTEDQVPREDSDPAAGGKPRPKQAAESDPAAKPDPKEDDTDPDEAEVTVAEPGKEPGKYVSKSAMLRAKQMAKEARDEAAALRERLSAREAEYAEIRGRMGLMTEFVNAIPKVGADGKPLPAELPKDPWQEADIDPVQDFVGAQQQDRRRMRYDKEQQTARATQAETHNKAATDDQRIQELVLNDAQRLMEDQTKKGEVVTQGEGDAAKTVSVFQAAYVWADNRLRAIAKREGITDRKALNQYVAAKERAVVAGAIRDKQSPAEAILDYAKELGFQAPAKAAANGTGTKVAKTAAQLEAERQIANLNEGMEEHKSFARAGGKAAGSFDIRALAEGSQEAYDAFVDKFGEEKVMKMLEELDA